MTRSPAAIMPKSSMALPTEPRNWACRRSRVREGFTSTEVDCTVGLIKWLQARSASGSGAALGAFQVLCLDIADEGSGRQRLAGRAHQQILHEHFGAMTIDVRLQPFQQSAELAAG